MTAVILVATGLRREARLLASPPLSLAVVGGGDAGALARRLVAAPAAEAVLSAGLAGALAPDLAPGACVIATEIVAGDSERFPAHPAWSAALSQRLRDARRGAIAGADVMLPTRTEKAALRCRSGAEAVDMESHVAARFAAARGVPFAAVRVISDAADRELPPAARVGIRADGAMDLPAVLVELLERPRQLGALVRVAHDAETAFRVLAGLRAKLGDRFALP